MQRPIFDANVWLIHDAGDGVTPLSFRFPTPLQWKPPANTKACLMASDDVVEYLLKDSMARSAQ